MYYRFYAVCALAPCKILHDIKIQKIIAADKKKHNSACYYEMISYVWNIVKL